MAEAETIPAESEALTRTLATVAELGLGENLIELETQGFTTVKGVLSESQIERAKAAILARAERDVGHSIDPATATAKDCEGMTYIPYMLYEDEVFEEILMAREPLALITYLLGESCLLSSMGCHFRGPGGMHLPLHSDNGNGIPAPFTPFSQVANVNYALTPYTRDAGALAMVPGSHKLARQPKPDESDLGDNANPNAVSMNIDPGDAVIWHGNSWHGSFVRKLPGVRMNWPSISTANTSKPKNATAPPSRKRSSPATPTTPASSTYWAANNPTAGKRKAPTTASSH